MNQNPMDLCTLVGKTATQHTDVNDTVDHWLVKAAAGHAT